MLKSRKLKSGKKRSVIGDYIKKGQKQTQRTTINISIPTKAPRTYQKSRNPIISNFKRQNLLQQAMRPITIVNNQPVPSYLLSNNPIANSNFEKNINSRLNNINNIIQDLRAENAKLIQRAEQAQQVIKKERNGRYSFQEINPVEVNQTLDDIKDEIINNDKIEKEFIERKNYLNKFNKSNDVDILEDMGLSQEPSARDLYEEAREGEISLLPSDEKYQEIVKQQAKTSSTDKSSVDVNPSVPVIPEDIQEKTEEIKEKAKPDKEEKPKEELPIEDEIKIKRDKSVDMINKLLNKQRIRDKEIEKIYNVLDKEPNFRRNMTKIQKIYHLKNLLKNLT